MRAVSSSRSRVCAATFVLTSMVARAATAQVATPTPQGPGTISGVVVDSLDRPVADATVYIVNPRRTVISRANGTFRFDSVPEGKYTIGARKIGYISSGTGEVKVGPQGAAAIIQMLRFQTELPTVTTTARRGGLSGVIGDTTFQAMPGVTVKVLGSGAGATTTDSTGEFWLPVKPGRYMVRLERPGYRRQLVAVTVPDNEGRRIAAWLAPMVGKENPRVGANVFDLEQRLIRMSPVWSKLYTSEDITKLGIRDALDAAQRFAASRLTDDECAYIDGGPERAPLWTIDATEIELMETNMVKPMRSQRTSINGGGGRTIFPNMRDMSTCNHYVWLRK